MTILLFLVFSYVLVKYFTPPPSPQWLDSVLSVVKGLQEMHTDEDGPALVFHCRTGKGRTTTAMAVAGLIVCHIKVRNGQNVRGRP